MQESISNNGLYRSKDGVFFGVCRGLSNWSEISVFWIRLIFLITLIAGFFPTIIVYAILAISIRPEPEQKVVSREEYDFYQNYMSSKKSALSRLKEQLEGIEYKTRRLEGIVTSKEFKWDRRMGNR